MHCISSRCLIFPLAHLLIYYVFRRHAAHSNNSNNNKNRSTAEQRTPSALCGLLAALPNPTSASAQVALDAIIQPTKTAATCAARGCCCCCHCCCFSCCCCSCPNAFFSLDFLHDFCLCWPPAVPSSSPLPLSSTYPLCPALPCLMLSAYIG